MAGINISFSRNVSTSTSRIDNRSVCWY